MAEQEFTTEERLDHLKRLVKAAGFDLLEGSFVKRDGSISPYYLKPMHVGKLLGYAAQALKNNQTDPE